jgi:hypothetical protein
MLPTTADAMRALLKADPSLTPTDRARIIGAVRSHGRDEQPAKVAAAPKESRVLTRIDVARRFNRSLRFVDKLAVEGILRRVKMPGRQRGCGFLAEDVERLMAGGIEI